MMMMQWMVKEMDGDLQQWLVSDFRWSCHTCYLLYVARNAGVSGWDALRAESFQLCSPDRVMVLLNQILMLTLVFALAVMVRLLTRKERRSKSVRDGM